MRNPTPSHGIGEDGRWRDPLGIGRHEGVRTAAGHELQRRVERFHRLGRLIGDPAVFVSRLVPDLPGPVHLIAKTPQTHVIWLAPPILDPQVAPMAAAGMIAIFEQPARRVEVA
jgi:hypothetical protein